MAYRRRHHFHQLALVLLELELEVVAPVSEQDHGARDVVVLNIYGMQTDDLQILKLFLIVVLRRFHHVLAVDDLVEAVALVEHQCALD